VELLLGRLKRGLLSGDYLLKKDLETEHLSIQKLREGNLEEFSFTGETEGYVEQGSGDEHLFS
jgi:hypothetical protein